MATKGLTDADAERWANAWFKAITEEHVANDGTGRHGGPYDRGMADSYYRRPYKPHYYVGATGTSERVDEEDMTADELAEYACGFADNENAGDFKDYG